LYAKLFTSITESSLWSEPKEVRLLFVTMLAKADQDGFVEASIPGLARVANLTIDETESSLRVLMSPDPYSKNPANEGRRIAELPGGFLLLNYEDYRSRRSAEERREYMRQYMQEYRTKTEGRKQSVNKRKQSVNSVNRSKPPLAHTEADTEAKAKKGNSCAEVGKQPTALAFDPSACRFPVFPCTGNPKTWQATGNQLDAWQEAYPGIDVNAEHRKAHVWIMANLTRRKSATGYSKYLNGWMSRSQDSGKGQRAAESDRHVAHKSSALTADEIAEYNRTGDVERFLR
jgi:hypothetical protein